MARKMQYSINETVKDKAPVRTAQDISQELFDTNDALIDEYGEILKRQAGTELSCPEELYKELLTKTDQCQALFKNFVNQRLLLNEARIRFRPGNDIAGLQTQCEAADISNEMKQFLREAGNEGYKILQKHHLLGYYIELDSKKEETFVYSEKNHRLTEQIDFVGLATTCLVGKCNNTSCPESTAITFHLTPRNYTKASTVFQQAIFMAMYPFDHLFFLTCHFGPLIEKQEVALYEYCPSEELKEAASSQKNVNEMHKIWMNEEGKVVRTLADIKEYLRHYLYIDQWPGFESDKKKKHRQHSETKTKGKKSHRKKKYEMSSETSESSSSSSSSVSRVSSHSQCTEAIFDSLYFEEHNFT